MPGSYKHLYGLRWLGEQAAARWRRKDWTGGIQEFADELWTVMSRLQDIEPQVIEQQLPDGTTVDISDGGIDQDFSTPPITPPDDDQTDPSGSSTVVSTSVSRSTIPARINSHMGAAEGTHGPEGGDAYGIALYGVTLFPFGPREVIYLDYFDQDDYAEPDDQEVDAVALQLQLRVGEQIPVGTWVPCIRIALNTTTTTYTVVEGQIQVTQLVDQSAAAHYIQVPVWL